VEFYNRLIELASKGDAFREVRYFTLETVNWIEHVQRPEKMIGLEIRDVNESVIDKLMTFVSLEKLKIFEITTELQLRLVMKLLQHSYLSLKELRVRFSTFVD